MTGEQITLRLDKDVVEKYTKVADLAGVTFDQALSVVLSLKVVNETPAATKNYNNFTPTKSTARKFHYGQLVTKTKGSKWTGHVVGFYTTDLNPAGYAIESATEKGSVQIYPEAALMSVDLPNTPKAPAVDQLARELGLPIVEIETPPVSLEELAGTITPSADARSVTTDALETLGMIHVEQQKRDAIHLAVEPVIAAMTLVPGEHICLGENGLATVAPPSKALGIVDPFLTTPVEAGESFWLVVYPRRIKSLRHVWEHPDFPPSTD